MNYQVKQTDSVSSPLLQHQRIHELDVLRGFAVLGILIMNIQSYSMIEAAYLNPTAYGDFTGANKWVWIVSHVIADQKFITIFSMLFGAGVILFTDRLEQKGIKPLRIYYKRIFWLLIIGLIHGYFFWHGDILVNYAICGALVYWVRKWKVRGLLTLGLFLFLVPAFNYWLFGATIEYWPPESVDALKQSWRPDAAAIANEVEMLRGNFFQQMQWRFPVTFNMETSIFLINLGWRVSGMMIVGMALYKSGVLLAKRSMLYYFVVLILGLAIGLSLIVSGLIRNFEAGWSAKYSMFQGSIWNYIGSFFVALAYISKIMIGSKIKFLETIYRGLADVGRMAFTNYILMTLICTFLFYGHGLGLFGTVERTGQAAIVLVVWIILILFSIVWMRAFNYGPLEWLWRALTYGKKAPMKKIKV